jgi:hypothetical protein
MVDEQHFIDGWLLKVIDGSDMDEVERVEERQSRII